MSVKTEPETPEPSSSSTASASSATLEPGEWETLRERSLQIGGFGEERAELWPKLLNAHNYLYQNLETRPKSHKDERQIRLDTDRSFVLYPVGDVKKDKETLQEELYQLIIEIFRRRPKLSYFQGYHDIVTVLFLTLPPEVQLACAEKISLHRLRDSMGVSLEPVLGLLRFMKVLIRVVDPQYAEMLEETVPLPYFALSNLLTLFSHDMPTLPLIQHVFDYLLCRPPIMVVYLATAITLSRKQEVQQLQEEGEAGMLHSLLTGLPNLTDGDQDSIIIKTGSSGETNSSVGSNVSIKEDATLVDEYIPLEDSELKLSKDSQNPVSTSIDSVDNTESNLDAENTLVDVQGQVAVPENNSDIAEVSKPTGATLGDDPQPRISSQPSSTSLSKHSSRSASSSSIKSKHDSDDDDLHTRKPTIPLSDLLKHADTLFESYPPSHPNLSLSSIMGPKSVVFTWSTIPSEMPNDDTAEEIVEHPELVVYPPVEELDDDDKEKEEEAEKERRRGHSRKLRKNPKRLLDPSNRRAMVASAILVLGIAMAVYGATTHGGIGRHGRHGGNHFTEEHWRKLGRWVVRVVVGWL